MQAVTVTSTAWGAVIASSTVDTIVQAKGAVRLCFGPSTGISPAVGIDVDAGYQVIVPAGIDLYAVAVGVASAQLITGPFGT